MRRIDREINSFNDIVDILKRCATIRIGIKGREFPYVVPVSFCFEIIGNQVFIYGHGAREGFKNELLEENSNVCIEADIFHGIEKTDHGITTKYESVIGFGKYELITLTDDKIRILKLMTERYGYSNYQLSRCRGLELANVFRISVNNLTGKCNL